MSLDDSDDYAIPDGIPVNPSLEAAFLPKFDMHLYRSCLDENHVKYYRIPEDLHLRRAAPIAMAWRHHDSNVAEPFPKSNEYNEQDVAKLQEVAVSLHKPYNGLLYVAALTMSEFLRLPNLHGCKIVAGALLSPGASIETYLSTLATRLEDITPKTGDMETAKVACRKVIADREKKKRKAEATAAAKANGDDDVDSGRVASKKCTGGVGTSRKKRKTHAGTLPNVFETASAARLAALRNQTDEQGTPLDLAKGNEEPAVGGEKSNGDDNPNVVFEVMVILLMVFLGYTPSLVPPTILVCYSDFGVALSFPCFCLVLFSFLLGPRVESAKKPMHDKAPLNA
nr:hypothetical protein [Tanacetum cinerariifolium]